MGTDPSSDFQGLGAIPRLNTDPSTSYPPPDDVMFDGTLPLGVTYSSNEGLFSDQFWGPMSNMTGVGYFNREHERDGEDA